MDDGSTSIQVFGPDGALKASRTPLQPAAEPGTFTGSALVQVIGPDGTVKHERRIGNLITDAGDLYIASKVIAGIAPAAPAAPTAASGMKLGTGSTAVSKAGAGAALVTYLSGSNLAFDATYPQVANLGAGLGVNAVYRTTWPPGVATHAALTEAVIVNDAAANATSTAANTYQRIVFAALPKAAGDSLVILWNAKALGA